MKGVVKGAGGVGPQLCDWNPCGEGNVHFKRKEREGEKKNPKSAVGLVDEAESSYHTRWQGEGRGARGVSLKNPRGRKDECF